MPSTQRRRKSRFVTFKPTTRPSPVISFYRGDDILVSGRIGYRWGWALFRRKV